MSKVLTFRKTRQSNLFEEQHVTTFIGVTGHRPDKLGGYNQLDLINEIGFKVAKRALEKMIEEHLDIVVNTGMAQGWDQIIADACISLDIPFIACIPCNGQESKWPMPAQRKYHELLSKCMAKHVTSPVYTPTCMNDRNKYIVDNSDVIIALWNGDQSGGTFNCVKYAHSKEKRIINCWDMYKTLMEKHNED